MSLAFGTPATSLTDVSLANSENVPGAVLRVGNLPNTGPRAANQGIHSGDDVILTAMGPGAEKVRGQMENTDVFRVIAEALTLAPLAPRGKAAAGRASGQ